MALVTSNMVIQLVHRLADILEVYDIPLLVVVKKKKKDFDSLILLIAGLNILDWKKWSLTESKMTVCLILQMHGLPKLSSEQEL